MSDHPSKYRFCNTSIMAAKVVHAMEVASYNLRNAAKDADKELERLSYYQDPETKRMKLEVGATLKDLTRNLKNANMILGQAHTNGTTMRNLIERIYKAEEKAKSVPKA